MSKEEKKPPPPKKTGRKNPYAQLTMELQKMVKDNNKKNPAPASNKGSSYNDSSKNKSSDKSNNSDKMKQAKDFRPSKDIEEPEDPDVPNRTYGDLYCKICDSHMNSEAMWEAHISGRRHLKNVKKGDTDSKYDVLDVESVLMPVLKDVKEPIVGLSYVQETRRREPNVPSCFNCFLCHSSLSTPALVVEHLTGKKHRLNYIKEHCPSEYELIAAINLKKGAIEPLVYEGARKLEEKFTRGTVIVKIEKPKRLVPPPGGKRVMDYDDDVNDFKKFKYSRSDPKEPSSWKSLDTARKPSGREYETQHKRLTYHPDEDDFNRRHRREDSPELRYDSRYLADYSPKHDYMQERDYPHDDYFPEKKYPRERGYSPEKVDYEKSSLYDTKYPRSYEPPPSSEDIYSKVKYEKKISLDNKYPRSYEPQPSSDDIYPKPRKNNYRKPNDSSLASEKYGPPSPGPYQQPPATVLPHEKPSVSAPSEPFELKDFVQKVFALPAETFLKIAIHKMDSMDLKEIDELSLLCKLMNKIRDLICSKLPPEMQNLIKQKLNDNVTQPAPAVPQQVTPPAETIYNKPAVPQEKQPDYSFIRDILSSANIEMNVGPSSHMSQSQQNASVLNSLQSNVASLFANKIASQFQDRNTFSAPAQVEPRTMYQNQVAPAQAETRTMYQSQVAPAQVEPRTMYQGQVAPTQVESRTMYQNQVAPTQMDRNVTYSASASTSAYANQSTAPSAYYNSRQTAKPSVNIPGLTLADNEQTESQLYSNYKSNYPASDSDRRQGYSSANPNIKQNYPPANSDARKNYPFKY